MMSVTSWSSLVGWFAPHALIRILLIECLNRYDRRPRLHPRLLTLHLSFLQASPLRNTALGGSPLFHSSRNRFSFAWQVDPFPPHLRRSYLRHLLLTVSLPSSVRNTLLLFALSDMTVQCTCCRDGSGSLAVPDAGHTKQHAEGRSGRHMLIWSLLLVRFANRTGGGAIRQVLNRKLSVAFQKLQFTAAEMTRQQFMMQGVLDRVHR